MKEDSIRQTLAQNIKRFRELRSISQADLAFTAGISIPFLSDIERGNKWPSPETIAKIAGALKVESFRLFSPTINLPDEHKAFMEKLFGEISMAQGCALKMIFEKYLT